MFKIYEKMRIDKFPEPHAYVKGIKPKYSMLKEESDSKGIYHLLNSVIEKKSQT